MKQFAQIILICVALTFVGCGDTETDKEEVVCEARLSVVTGSSSVDGMDFKSFKKYWSVYYEEALKLNDSAVLSTNLDYRIESKEEDGSIIDVILSSRVECDCALLLNQLAKNVNEVHLVKKMEDQSIILKSIDDELEKITKELTLNEVEKSRDAYYNESLETQALEKMFTLLLEKKVIFKIESAVNQPMFYILNEAVLIPRK